MCEKVVMRFFYGFMLILKIWLAHFWTFGVGSRLVWNKKQDLKIKFSGSKADSSVHNLAKMENLILWYDAGSKV